MSINKDEFLDFLEDYLMEEEAKELEIKITGEEEQDAPLIDSMQKANYFLKLVSKIKEDIDSINEMCDSEIEKVTNRVNHYREAKIKPLANQIAYYEKLLKNYTQHELEVSNKRSIKLPYGTLSMKKQQPKWEYGDEKELIAWIQDNGYDSILNEKITCSLDKKLLKSAAFVTEEGVQIKTGDEKHDFNYRLLCPSFFQKSHKIRLFRHR